MGLDSEHININIVRSRDTDEIVGLAPYRIILNGSNTYAHWILIESSRTSTELAKMSSHNEWFAFRFRFDI